MFKSIVWSSTIDYPEQISTVLFVDICNWKCSFCHNYNLNDNNSIDFQKDILPKLIDRKEFINHIIISGGECTLYPKLIDIIKQLKGNGFVVGIHTNGSNPTFLKEVIPLIKFVGMDIKTSKSKYNLITQTDVDYTYIIKSIELIVKSGINYDFRTTVYPKYVDLNDCLEIANLLCQFKANKYVLQQYDNSFDKSMIEPYPIKYLKEIQTECNKIIPTFIKGW